MPLSNDEPLARYNPSTEKDCPMKPSACFEYVNRKGRRYYLCEARTKNGGSRYVFSREMAGTPVSAVPSGYEVVESVNGVVSLRRAGSCAIREDEVAIVRAALAKHPHLTRCRVDARKREVVVYEAQTSDPKRVARYLGGDAPIEGVLDRGPLSPVLRFVLDDEEERMFLIQRMCYRGSIDGWLTLSDGGGLEELANRYVQHLGKESFLELQ